MASMAHCCCISVRIQKNIHSRYNKYQFSDLSEEIEMAESAISFLLNELSVLLKEEQKLLAGLGQEVEIIHGKLEQMRAFLRVADSKEETDPLLKEWIRQMREIAYDIEDVLDNYMLRFGHRDAHGFRGCLKNCYASMKSLKARHQIASQIKTIKSRLDEASEHHRTLSEKYPLTLLGSSSDLSTNTSYDGRGDALLLEDIDVVGIEGPKQQLLRWFSAAEYGLKVISVVGMPGVGKTTLVKKVYDDPSLVEMNFEHRVWINVSESFRAEIILEDIIKQLVKQAKQPPPPELESMNDNAKKDFIYKFLQNKNYIIVLDDVWRIDAWEAVKYAFPRSTTQGRGFIVITSRFSSIGNAACSETNGHVYTLKPLPEDKSRSLFYKKAFPGNSSCPPYLKEISENILRRCEGWPLAIVVTGGLLATKNNKLEEWEMFNRSLGSEIVGDSQQRMSKLLSLSFYDLPYYLKTCFLYLSIFSEDEVIEKATVIRLWIAEGFVEGKQGKTMSEIAEGYLNELVNRSLIQVETNYDGRLRNFRFHDLLREYVISKAKDHDIAFVYSGGEMQRADRIRRLALHSSINFTDGCYRFEHLHSLLFMGPVDLEWLPMLYKMLCGGCRTLKVLNLRRAPMATIPNEVFKLYHLKFLSLRDTQVKVIPKSIGNLRKLEMLDLKRTMVTELPVEILKLQRLQNLLVYRYKNVVGVYRQFDGVRSFRAPYEIGQLVYLQKLSYIDVDDIIVVREIGKLSQLQRLGITKLRREDCRELCSSLAKLTRLRSLTIVAFEEDELIDLDYPDLSPCPFPLLRNLELRGCLQKVPQWISGLNALTRIHLRWNRLREDPLECLQCLPNLQHMEMDCAYEGEELSFSAGGFERLTELVLLRIKGLRRVRIEKGSMPLLQSLEVWGCKSMVDIPEGIEHLSDLAYVDFSDMAEEFVERLLTDKREQGDRWILDRIPQLYVRDVVNGKFQFRLSQTHRK